MTSNNKFIIIIRFTFGVFVLPLRCLSALCMCMILKAGPIYVKVQCDFFSGGFLLLLFMKYWNLLNLNFIFKII